MCAVAGVRRVLRAARLCAACAVVAAGYGCSGNPRPGVAPVARPSPAPFVASEVIAEVKDFAIALGGHADGQLPPPIRSSELR